MIAKFQEDCEQPHEDMTSDLQRIRQDEQADPGVLGDLKATATGQVPVLGQQHFEREEQRGVLSLHFMGNYPQA